MTTPFGSKIIVPQRAGENADAATVAAGAVIRARAFARPAAELYAIFLAALFALIVTVRLALWFPIV